MKQLFYIFICTLLFLQVSKKVDAQGCHKGVRYNCVWGCGRHIDINNDGFCDFSYRILAGSNDTLPPPIYDSVRKHSFISTLSEKEETADEEQNERETEEKKISVQEEESEKQKNLDIPDVEGPPTLKEDEEPEVAPTPSLPSSAYSEPLYDLILISFITLALYFTTWGLYKKGAIKRVVHRKIWNLLLLLTFIGSCLLGLVLVIQLNYKVAMSIYSDFLFWHVEIGIAMSIIAVIHILWHITYFKNMLKKW